MFISLPDLTQNYQNGCGYSSLGPRIFWKFGLHVTLWDRFCYLKTYTLDFNKNYYTNTICYQTLKYASEISQKKQVLELHFFKVTPTFGTSIIIFKKNFFDHKYRQLLLVLYKKIQIYWPKGCDLGLKRKKEEFGFFDILWAN